MGLHLSLPMLTFPKPLEANSPLSPRPSPISEEPPLELKKVINC